MSNCLATVQTCYHFDKVLMKFNLMIKERHADRNIDKDGAGQEKERKKERKKE